MEIKSTIDTKNLRLRRGIMIKALRKKRGLTQPELAKLIGICQGRVSDYERGKKSPAIDRLPVLAAALDVEIDDLLFVEQPAKNDSLDPA